MKEADTKVRFLSDPWADIEKPLSGNSSGESGNNLHGCLEQLYLLKKQNRSLKVLLSIGGWTYSSNFASPASTSIGRSTFASSVVSLVENYGLDGVDIDWEYPANASQAIDMVALLQTVRQALDTYGNSLSTPYHFILTAACPGPYGYQYLRLSEMNQTVDFWNFMAYDYTGPWSNVTGDQANLFHSSSYPESTPFDTASIISYISQNISFDKIVLGIPLYGRAFNDTDGLGEPFSGSRTYDVKDLPLSGTTEACDNATGSCYSYGNRELISYDLINPVVYLKADFIQNKTLGGAMFWESSMDGVGDMSIIQNMARVLGGIDGSGLDKSQNQLLYPNSSYDNLLKSISVSSSSPATCQAATLISTLQISSTTGALSPSALPTTCDVGPAIFECVGGMCTCGLDTSYQPVCYNPEGTCYNEICSASSDCGINKTCLPNGCGSASEARCAQVLVGCLDSPQITEIVFSPVATSN